MTPDEAVKALDNVGTNDPEYAHWAADQILLACVPQKVKKAYVRVIERSRWWAHA